MSLNVASESQYPGSGAVKVCNRGFFSGVESGKYRSVDCGSFIGLVYEGTFVEFGGRVMSASGTQWVVLCGCELPLGTDVAYRMDLQTGACVPLSPASPLACDWTHLGAEEHAAWLAVLDPSCVEENSCGDACEDESANFGRDACGDGVRDQVGVDFRGTCGSVESGARVVCGDLEACRVAGYRWNSDEAGDSGFSCGDHESHGVVDIAVDAGKSVGLQEVRVGGLPMNSAGKSGVPFSCDTPGYCYLVFFRPESRQRIGEDLGPWPLFESVLFQPLADWVDPGDGFLSILLEWSDGSPREAHVSVVDPSDPRLFSGFLPDGFHRVLIRVWRAGSCVFTGLGESTRQFSGSLKWMRSRPTPVPGMRLGSSSVPAEVPPEPGAGVLVGDDGREVVMRNLIWSQVRVTDPVTPAARGAGSRRGGHVFRRYLFSADCVSYPHGLRVLVEVCRDVVNVRVLDGEGASTVIVGSQLVTSPSAVRAYCDWISFRCREDIAARVVRTSG